MTDDFSRSIILASSECETCGVNFNELSVYRDGDGYTVMLSVGCFGGASEYSLTAEAAAEQVTLLLEDEYPVALGYEEVAVRELIAELKGLAA
jgi:hypothetical protein